MHQFIDRSELLFGMVGWTYHCSVYFALPAIELNNAWMMLSGMVIITFIPTLVLEFHFVMWAFDGS